MKYVTPDVIVRKLISDADKEKCTDKIGEQNVNELNIRYRKREFYSTLFVHLLAKSFSLIDESKLVSVS